MFGQAFFGTIAVAFEVVGVLSMLVGLVVAVGISIRVWIRSRSGAKAFRTLRESFGGVILLGLEVLVAATLVKTVTSTPSLTDAVVLILIVLIRTVLSFSLQIEIDGVAPWRRALVTGPEVLVRTAARSGDRGSDAADSRS